MTDHSITCPNCNTEIALTEALTEKIKLEFQQKMAEELKDKKADLAKKEAYLRQQYTDMQKTINDQVAAARDKMAEDMKVEASKAVEVQLKALEQENIEKEKELKAMQETELELRRQKREIEAREQNMKIDLERKLDAERNRIAEDAKKMATEESRLKIAEKDKQLDQMKKTIEELKRKSEQGSMQIQGDVQENDLKMLLQQLFMFDTVEDVPTGIRGADLVQHVRNDRGQEVGIILWESKNTKAWKNEWTKKLKDDQALVKADMCILVSQVLPEGIEDFGQVDGVWVCRYSFVASLIQVLRHNMLHIASVKQSLIGKDQKMEVLYAYISGSEFKNRIENIVSAFSSMKSDLESEKRALQRIWNKREKEIERVITNTSGMYGDLQGLVGASLESIRALELPEGFDEE